MKFLSSTQVLLLVALWFSAAGARSSRADKPRMPAIQYTHQDIFQKILDKPLPSSCHHSRYTLNISKEPLCWFPVEIWMNILKHMDGKTLWDMGLACKWLGAVIRDNDLNFRQRWRHKWVIEEILVFSQLSITDEMWDVIKPVVETILPDCNDKKVEKLEEEKKKHLIEFVESFINRTCSPIILQCIIGRSGLINTEDYLRLLPSEHLYMQPCSDMPRYHYLPPAGTKIFDTIPIPVLAVLLSSGSIPQRQMFSVTIMAEYFIPAFRSKTILDPQDQKALSDLYPSLRHGFDDFLTLIIWAIFLGYGIVDKGKSPELRFIIDFFKAHQMWWSEMRTELPMKIRLEKMLKAKKVPDMNAVLMMAKYWRIGYETVAEETKKWCPLSKQIDDRDIPGRFLSNSLPNSLELFEIVYGKRPEPISPDGNPELPIIKSGATSPESTAKALRPRKRQKINKEWTTPTPRAKPAKTTAARGSRKRGRPRKYAIEEEPPAPLFTTHLDYSILDTPQVLPLYDFSAIPQASEPQILRHIPPPVMVQHQIPQDLPLPLELPLSCTNIEPMDMDEEWEAFLDPKYRDSSD